MLKVDHERKGAPPPIPHHPGQRDSGAYRKPPTAPLPSDQNDDQLASTRYAWRYSRENLPYRYGQDLSALKDPALKAAHAAAIKLTLRRLWSYQILRGLEPF